MGIRTREVSTTRAKIPYYFMLVQNRILAAEPLRARRIYFLFGGEISPNKNLFLQSVSWAFGRLEIPRICSRREEVFDPIAVSRWDQKELSLCALCDSAVNLIFRKAQIN
jgi:hypothetical protein